MITGDAKLVYNAFQYEKSYSNSWGNATTSQNPYIIMYFPIPLKVSSFIIYEGMFDPTWSKGQSTNNIYASNTNGNWQSLVSDVKGTQYGQNTIVMSPITVNSDNFYKYYKIENTTPDKYGSSWYYKVSYVQINGTYIGSALNIIYLPTSYTSTNYGAAFTYIGGSSTTAYISNRTASTISLANVDSNVSSGSYITIGY